MSAAFRDTIREKNGVPHARETLAKFEAESCGYDDAQWAAAAGRFAATVEDLLGIVENLQAVADTRDRAREYAEQIERSGNRAYAKAGRELLAVLDGGEAR